MSVLSQKIAKGIMEAIKYHEQRLVNHGKLAEEMESLASKNNMKILTNDCEECECEKCYIFDCQCNESKENIDEILKMCQNCVPGMYLEKKKKLKTIIITTEDVGKNSLQIMEDFLKRSREIGLDLVTPSDNHKYGVNIDNTVAETIKRQHDLLKEMDNKKYMVAEVTTNQW